MQEIVIILVSVAIYVFFQILYFSAGTFEYRIGRFVVNLFTNNRYDDNLTSRQKKLFGLLGYTLILLRYY